MKRVLKTALTMAVLLGFGVGASLPASSREARLTAPKESRIPPAPLFRDPVFDGAADPSLIWNDRERTWWAFYTNRRANAPDAQDGVRWCHGTDIGIASSPDGRTWTYRGTARGLEFEPGRNTFWAPCLLEHGAAFHMFVAYVRGVPADWSGERHIVHYTSRDLVNWKYEAVIPLRSPNVIDAFVSAKPSGGWRMWYKDEAQGSQIWAADSEDLFRWSVRGPVVTSTAQEGPAVFWWHGSYWMLVDRWQGMGILRSADLEHWTEQPGTILGVPGTRPDDADIGRHGEVLVQGPDAYLFYFTHPFGPKEHVQPGKHRSSLQVARLEFADGKVVCDRNRPFDLELGPPSGFRPNKVLESPLELRTSDPKLAATFAWAKGQALDYAFPAETNSDPVGGWYEAALPGRFAFCMRDVSHQANGAHVLGLSTLNLNMLRKFAEGISASRRYCSYWEIDKGNRPAPVDYKNDGDFWYNLPANFDVMDACWRQFQWTGNRAYIEDPAFLAFYRLSTTSYIKAWDNDGDGVPDHRMPDGNRGLGSYDEGPLSDRTAAGADLLAAEAGAFLSYAAVLKLRGDAISAGAFEKRAAALQDAFYRKWWNPKLGRFAGLMLEGGALNFDDLFWYGVFPLYFGFLKPGPERDAILGRLAGAETDGVEVESYLPEVFYRYGRDEAAYTEVLRLSDPGKKRREYPEVPFALIGAVATGTMGIGPDAADRTVVTRSRLTAATDWAELVSVPVFGNAIDVRHDGKSRSTFTNRSGPALVWRAAFDGKCKELAVDGRPMEASQGPDEGGRDTSWVSVNVLPGRTITVAAVPSSPRLTAEVDAYLQPFLDAGGFSGAVLMAKGGRVLLDKGYGLASQEFGVPNTPRTKFQIASVSKTFTAAAIMILEERGKLSVRDPLTRFIPDYPGGDTIMIRHLLTHTSGIPNVNDFPEYDRESRFPHTLPQVIAMFKDKPLRFPPGERYEYSNSNYNLLAFVIEKASGLSYGDFLQKNIFGPLGMKDTADRASDGVIVPDLATGYVPSGAWGFEKAPFLDWTIKTGNGSLYSTVDDLYRWDRALHDGKILSRPSLDAMFTDNAGGMGYGWFVGKRSGRRVVRFNGRSPGTTSYLERYVDDDACIIILSNNYAPVPHAAIEGLSAILFGGPYTPLVLDKGFKADEAALEAFQGRYKFGLDFYRPSAEVDVRMEDGALAIVWSESYKSALRPLAKGVFLDRLFWTTILFKSDAEGKVTSFVWRDSKDYPAVRVNPVREVQRTG